MERREGINVLAQVALWLSVIGAINWGLVGFFNFDLVRAIFGNERITDASAVARLIYAIVGLAGITLAALAPRLRARAGAGAPLGGRPVEARQHP